VPQSGVKLGVVLDRLESFYGAQKATFPSDPCEFLIWWYCGYPASDNACTKGWDRLISEVGIEPEKLLAAKPAKLAAALKPGGMFPELRAERVKEVVLRVQNEFGGDLAAALHGPIAQARKILKSFPGIADPGADRILLFAGIAPIAAIPSNCLQVPIRILGGDEDQNYSSGYRDAQRAIAAEVAEKREARTRAYLLLKHHGQELCKRTNAKCDKCPIRKDCAYFARR